MASCNHNLTALLFVVCLVSSVPVRAEEGEKPAEGGAVMKPLPKDQKEFYEKTQRLNTLTSRIEEAEKQFNKLVRQKAAEKNPVELQRILKEMIDVTKERNKSADEYNKVKSDLTLRFPNQGEHLNRQYQTQTRKSVEELEGAAGLDELLTRTKKIVDKKFATFEDPNEPKPKPKAKANVDPATPEGEKPVRLKLEK